MHWFQNLKIGARLVIAFTVVVLFMAAVATVGFNGLRNMNEKSTFTYKYSTQTLVYINQITYAFGQMRADLRDMAQTVDASENNKLYNSISELITLFNDNLDSYDKVLVEGGYTNTEEYEEVIALKDTSAKFLSEIDKVSELAKNNQNTTAYNTIVLDIAPLSIEMNDLIDKLSDFNIVQAKNFSEQNQQTYTTSSTSMIIVSLVGAVLSILIAIYVRNTITKPINQLVTMANKMSDGNLDISIDYKSKDEMGTLTESFNTVAQTFKSITNDLRTLSNDHENGDIDARINSQKYRGGYSEMSASINAMVNSYVVNIREILDALRGFGDGDFNVSLRKYPGKKAEINDSVEQLRNNLQSISAEINSLVNAAILGKLSVRADADNYHGDWADILAKLNDLLNSVVMPISEASEVLQQVSQGNLNVKVTGDYKGDFAQIKDSLNRTVDSLRTYIDDISYVLNEISSDNLNLEITREYLGDFVTIKDSLNTIVTKLNKVMEEINSATEQVDTGAKQISDSSMSLAQGATEQASSIEQLNATLITINEQTQSNAQNAKQASTLSSVSRENAQNGNAEMKNMLVSMEQIKQASNNISKIIKVIDDIAFQTNLLAINASVEAAHAGIHGKGFAVVANEVRNLANKSKDAASQTATLIEDSINRVTEGTTIAQTTANALEKMVVDVTEVSTIIEQIAASSGEQAYSMGQVNIGINQISQVIQDNSSNSEESAAAAQELASQSEMLRAMINTFKLRDKINSEPKSYVALSKPLSDAKASPPDVKAPSTSNEGITGNIHNYVKDNTPKSAPTASPKPKASATASSTKTKPTATASTKAAAKAKPQTASTAATAAKTKPTATASTTATATAVAKAKPHATASTTAPAAKFTASTKPERTAAPNMSEFKSAPNIPHSNKRTGADPSDIKLFESSDFGKY